MMRILFFCNFSFVLLYNILAVNVPLNPSASSMSQPSKEKEIVFRQEEEDVGPPELNSTLAPRPPKECMCSKIYDPVCATDDKSYFNMCVMECDPNRGPNVTFAHQGICIPF